MTVTSKSGTSLKSFADAPVVDSATPVTGPEERVTVKMVLSRNGLNPGEVGRYPAQVAQQMIDKGEAVAFVSSEAHLNLGGFFDYAINLHNEVKDANENLRKRREEVAELRKEADEAGERARREATSQVQNALSAVQQLQNKHDAFVSEEKRHIKELEDAVVAADKVLDVATKAVKKAEDKDAAQAAVTVAEADLDSLKVGLAATVKTYEETQQQRQGEINTAKAAADRVAEQVQAKLAEFDKRVGSAKNEDSGKE